MATVYGPLLEDSVVAVEDYGVPTEVRATYMVTGVAGATASQKLENALAESGVPEYNDTPAAFPGMRCIRREAQFVSNQETIVKIVCSYVNLRDIEDRYIFHIGTTTTQEMKATDYFGSQLTTSYTYPTNYPDNPNLAGQTITQGGEIPVLYPQVELTAIGITEVEFPLELIQKWLLRRNEEEWQGGTAGKWLCTNIQADPWDMTADTPKWQFRFSFQYNWNGWNSTIVFVDPSTGKPPSNLVDGTGIKSIAHYPAIDYNIEEPIAGRGLTLT